jgi:hypothetical protein
VTWWRASESHQSSLCWPSYADCSVTAAKADVASPSGPSARACRQGRHWHCSHRRRTSSDGSGPVCCLRHRVCLACRRARGVIWCSYSRTDRSARRAVRSSTGCSGLAASACACSACARSTSPSQYATAPGASRGVPSSEEDVLAGELRAT